MAKLLSEQPAADPSYVGPPAWLARDGYVAETAVRLDKLTAAVDRLFSESRWARDHVEELQMISDTARREHAYEETLRNSRELKIDEIVRTVRDLRERVAAVEGTRAAFAGLTYKSFETVDAKVKEMAEVQIGLKHNLWLMGTALATSLSLTAGLVAARLFVS